MRSVSTDEMKRLDRRAAEKFGISTLILMENAGRGIADLAEKIVKNRRGRILIVCGKGNNGGDGFVAARHLFNRGHSINVVLLAKPNELSGDAEVNYSIVKKMGIQTLSLRGPEGRSNPGLLRSLHLFAKTADLIIDAIFGIGLSRDVTGLMQTCIGILNQSKKKILSIDIPSGIHSDTGKVMNAAIKATVTGTLHAPKIGLLRKPGCQHAGRVEVLDISIPRK